MAMPKNITLINERTGNEKKVDFEHGGRLLRLEKKNGTNSFSVKGKYFFDGNDIRRQPSDKDSQGEAE